MAELKAHPFFKGIDWDKLLLKEIPPPFVPVTGGIDDVSNIDPEFLQEEPKETFATTSPLLEAYKSNELFTNFDYVNEDNLYGGTEFSPSGSVV